MPSDPPARAGEPSPALMSILFATTNRGKLAEIKALLANLPVEVLAASDVFSELPAVVEDGDTFEVNAKKKAREVAAATMMLTLADDSGLEVEALGGQPGVRSARFAHEGATDAENNAALLSLMKEVDDDCRSARFRCVIALIDPWDEAEEIAVGSCEGSIARKPSGAGGFGYDPLFIVAGEQRTMAELSEAEKNRISHRAQALARLRPKLLGIIEHRLREAVQILGEPPAGSDGWSMP